MERLERHAFTGPLTFELNRSSKPNRHENDAYAATPLKDWMEEAIARARIIARRAWAEMPRPK